MPYLTLVGLDLDIEYDPFGSDLCANADQKI